MGDSPRNIQDNNLVDLTLDGYSFFKMTIKSSIVLFMYYLHKVIK